VTSLASTSRHPLTPVGGAGFPGPTRFRRLGWPEGEVVGAEAELLERFGVSRPLFREAVQLVEHRHGARMRRGPGGRLVVAAASVDAVADAVSVYLFYVGAEIDDVFEARLSVQEAAAELAPARLDEGHVTALRPLAAEEHAGLVAAITGNPALDRRAPPDRRRFRQSDAGASPRRSHLTVGARPDTGCHVPTRVGMVARRCGVPSAVPSTRGASVRSGV